MHWRSYDLEEQIIYYRKKIEELNRIAKATEGGIK